MTQPDRAESPDEAARLAALTSYDILDTGPEPAFDDLTRLASYVCGTPIALVSLIDRDRQWFKSKVGLDATQTPRDVAFCAHAIRGDDLLVVPDAAADARFRDNPLVTGVPHIRFYAGAPLTVAGGYRLGTLCVIDRTPRDLAPEQRDALRVLGRQVVAQIALRRRIGALEQGVAEGEDALRATERRFSAFMDNSPVVAFVKDEDGRFTYGNEPFRRLFNLGPGGWAGKTDAAFFPPEVARRLRENDRAVLAAGAPAAFEETVPTHEGAERHWLVYKFPFPDGGRSAVGGIAVDVTERKHAEARLDQQYELVNHIIASVPGLFYAFTRDGRYLRWNDEFERVTGYSPPELGRLHPLDLFEGDDRRRIGERIAEVFARGHATAEATLVSKTGGRRRHFFTGRSVVLNGTPCVVGVGIDIEERCRLEEQYRQAQKMEAVGRLAGGIAHDFNNLLTVINGFSDLLLSRLAPGAPHRGLVEQVFRAGERAASLTRQLLAFSRQQVLEPRVLNLNGVVAETEKMLRRLIGEDVALATDLAADLRPVKVDPGQVEQVILNLAVNARDAMPTGGRLTIATANADLTGADAPGRPAVRPGRYALLAVSDTGCGMTPEVRAHIFEPFFTTKGPGKGTGLGLATVFGIVEQSGGSIAVDTEPGRGTTFKIYLPAVEAPATPGETGPVNRPAPRGSETVLVAEDEGSVRDLIRLALESQGYAVLEADGGGKAQRLAEAHTGPIDLLVTDVVMPGMSGRELAARLTDLRPGLKVLYLSGYTDDAVVRHGGLESHAHFMQKPFTSGTLAARVRQILDAP